MDVFNENYIVAAANLATTREAKKAWGVALVRTDITNQELDFLARSFRGCVAKEKVQLEEYKSAGSVLRGLSRR